MQENSQWKTITYIFGGIIGLLTGLVAAYLFIRGHEGAEENPKLTSGQGVKIGMGIVTLLRQITDNTSK